MDNLSVFTTEELQREIDKRKLNQKLNKIPPFLSDEEIVKNIPKLKKTIIDNLKESVTDHSLIDDFDTFITEACLSAFFGESIWTFINNDLEEE